MLNWPRMRNTDQESSLLYLVAQKTRSPSFSAKEVQDYCSSHSPIFKKKKKNSVGTHKRESNEGVKGKATRDIPVLQGSSLENGHRDKR